MLALRRLVPATRSFHSTATAWKKAKASKAVEEDIDMDDGDLFAEDVADIQVGGGDRAERRREFISAIMNPTHGREEHRAGNLRKVVQFSDSEADLEELGKVIQQWRVNGYKVSKQTSTEIVGRCINLGHPELAHKYYKQRADYGLPPVSDHMYKKMLAAVKEQAGTAKSQPEAVKAEA